MTVARLANAVLAAPPRLGRVRVVAVDGPSGAGKSTLAGLLVAELRHRGRRVALISTDHFATWDDPVSWWPRLAEGVLDPLGRGEAGAYRKLDWTTGVPEPGELVSVAPPEVLVLEGVSSGRRSFRPSLSVLCWVPGPAEPVRLERAVQRDGEASRERLREWQVFERGWFAVDRPATDLTPNGLVLSAQNGHEIDVP
ncbi:uridine kinase [Amycolatopsis cynarae]|uniref:Uridine kinase n=1 Tax=Amycolatopsis cynarae TaxID=2995223 RepID=A0ABY7B534_9PSEU|nr:uridine kinase [Amycolatopsis sp. HUAS 11-8]WAL66016.1 uridine kinase [Amycolatopsis sp. HUAS 11-8]